MSRSLHRRLALVPLAACMTAAHAEDPFFSQPALTVEWLTVQTARTVDMADQSVLCESPWDELHTYDGDFFFFDQSRSQDNGGCLLVVLRRIADFSAAVQPAASATIDLVSRIEATTINGAEMRGEATGSMAGTSSGSVLVDRWCTADALLRFIADAGTENATISITGRLLGPIDPATNEGVLLDEQWTGSTREVRELDSLLLAPGRYELRADSQGTFSQIHFLRYIAQTSAYVRFDNPAPASPTPEWDLDGDGSVGLADACLWAQDPTDVDGDGDIEQADLAFLLALARAAGEDATDTDGDGIPDQCGGDCLADFNSDGLVDFFDVQSFLAAFAAGDLRADANGDQILDFFDLLAFLGEFSAGC